MTEQERPVFATDDDVEGHVNEDAHGAEADDDDDVEGHRAMH